MPRLARFGPALLLPALLAGCMQGAMPPLLDPTPAPAAPQMDGEAQRAVAACLDRAETQGLNVAGVDRTTEVVTVDGRAMGQNVFLDIGGGGPTVRCNYDYAAGEARIMTL